MYKLVRTFPYINYTLLVIGLLGVWFASHSFLAMVFAFIASIHVQITNSKVTLTQDGVLRMEVRDNVLSNFVEELKEDGVL